MSSPTFRIFISSPGDVCSERYRAEKIILIGASSRAVRQKEAKGRSEQQANVRHVRLFSPLLAILLVAAGMGGLSGCSGWRQALHESGQAKMARDEALATRSHAEGPVNASDPSNAEWQRDLSVSHEKIGEVLSAQGDLAGALRAFQ
ncbi:MAG: hypothetical protein HQL59_13715, partial [Magnetococcales bacterium]|nr:hypothetical protein [Magnetococcales bacterium]